LWNWPHVGTIKPEHSLINLLGRLIYHRQPPWEQRRKVIILLWSIIIGMVLGGIYVAVILFQTGHR
jgi:hypothetical protein